MIANLFHYYNFYISINYFSLNYVNYEGAKNNQWKKEVLLTFSEAWVQGRNTTLVMSKIAFICISPEGQ